MNSTKIYSHYLWISNKHMRLLGQVVFDGQ